MRFKYCPNCGVIYHEGAKECALPLCKGNNEWFPSSLQFVEDSTPPEDHRGPHGETPDIYPDAPPM